MMFYQHAGMGAGWLILAMILLATLLVVAVTALLARQAGGHSDAEDVLAHRLARGDIDPEEYQARLHELRATRIR